MGLQKVERKLNSKLAPLLQKAPASLNQASIVLAKTSNVLSKVSNVSGKILNNPITAGIVASNPELLPIYGGAIGASKMLGQGANVIGKVAIGASVAGVGANLLEKARAKPPPRATAYV